MSDSGFRKWCLKKRHNLEMMRLKEREDEDDSWHQVSNTKNVNLSNNKEIPKKFFIGRGIYSDENQRPSSCRPILAKNKEAKKFSTDTQCHNVKISSLKQQDLINKPLRVIKARPIS